jgi:hypothetical protein
MLILISLTLLSSLNIHASCRISSSVIDSEDTPSFAKSNLSSSFDQGKHQAYPSLRLLLLKVLLYVLDCALNCKRCNETVVALRTPLIIYFFYTYERKITAVCYA